MDAEGYGRGISILDRRSDRSEEGTQEGRTGYANESKNSLEQGESESVGEMTLWK